MREFCKGHSLGSFVRGQHPPHVLVVVVVIAVVVGGDGGDDGDAGDDGGSGGNSPVFLAELESLGILRLGILDSAIHQFSQISRLK